MITVDWKLQKQAFLDVIETHGTRTQGEGHRHEQIVERLIEMTSCLVDVLAHSAEASSPVVTTYVYVK